VGIKRPQHPIAKHHIDKFTKGEGTVLKATSLEVTALKIRTKQMEAIIEETLDI